MSLAGAQHKMLVLVSQGKLYEPQPDTPSTHILKPNHRDSDYPASVMNEYATMKLAQATATRELDRLVKAVPVELEKLYADIEAGIHKDLARCPNPTLARQHIADELHLLRAFRHIVVADMVTQLS